MLTLVNTEYESPAADKKNIFYGTFCQFATQMFATVAEAAAAMDDIRIYGPPILEEHFILHDATGASLVIELVGGVKKLYLDLNDNGVTGFGIMTNEPELSYHLTNVEHYEWKRSLSRQAVAVPGGWYPEDR
jgi:choloylglycine hydrolase